ncbi:MAG: protein kinase [Gammaproteobacteria bacterium]|nr:protein kinase [Gammaproteobacteria bacterium]
MSNALFSTHHLTSDLPEKIGKYPVVGTAGRGNMGVVYIGYDPFHNRDVAIKVCKLSPGMEDETARLARKMFFNEAHTAEVLDHPNITRVLDAGEEDDEPYLVMEYVDGATTLESYCKPGRLLPLARVAQVIFDCAKALDYAHRRGVIHRDIKPSNLMLTDDADVKIGDFGVAQLPTEESTYVMGIMGSPRYMSPEQLRDEQLSGRTDLYSLGVVMFELLTGQPPFQAGSFAQLVKDIVNEEPPSLATVRPELPENVIGIVERALMKDPGERYQTGSEFASDLVAAFPSLAGSSAEKPDADKLSMARKIPLFNDFSDDELDEVLFVGDWEKYGPGETIIKEGLDDYSFCVLITGDVVVKKRGQDLTTLKAGDCFGEMSYLARSRRTATISALNDVRILRINETQMEQAQDSVQARFNKVFLKTLVRRLEKTSDELTNQSAGQNDGAGDSREYPAGTNASELRLS